MSTRTCDEYGAVLAGIRSSRMAKAGLRGPYAAADCPEGRRVYSLALAGRGSYLYGATGRGKTWAAACAVRLAAEGGRRARLVTSRRLLEEIRGGYDGGDRFALDRAARTWLLVLDDLGAERPTDWAIEQLTGLVDERVSAGLPTVVTSNYAPGELGRLWGGMPGARIASRLGGACEMVEVAGPDRRLLHGAR